MNPVLQTILEDYADGVLGGLEEAFERPVLNFRRDLYPTLSLLDTKIPGIGMQFAVWSETTPHYPFSQEFDGVVRPLRYIPYALASGVPFEMMARDIVSNSGGHLEECIKELCRVRGIAGKYYSRVPLGSLANRHHVRSFLGAMLADAISQFCRISWNQAKHQYADGYPKSVISVQDAIGSYFVVRALGARVLIVAGRMDALITAIDDAKSNRRFYVTGELPKIGDHDTPWSVSDTDFAGENNSQEW